MKEIEKTPEFQMGDTFQKLWAKMMAEQGNIVLPAYELKDADPATKAPILFASNSVYVTPDLLIMTPGKIRWHEVKAKTRPSWRIFHPGPRWEHGIDYSLAIEYRNVQDKTGILAWLIVHEIKSPANPSAESDLIRGSTWLAISLDKAFEFGQWRVEWPGGKLNPGDRGRRNMGGLLWPRSEMMKVRFK